MFAWEKCFQKHILERGWGYAQKGAVMHLVRNGAKIEAIVAGTEYYRVRITCDGTTVSDAYCSCPYASDGNYCKHMAAVLYAADFGSDQGADARDDHEELHHEELYHDELDAGSTENSRISIVDMIHRADRSKLEAALIDLAESDDKMESRIRSMIAGTEPDTSIDDLKEAVDSIFEAYTDCDGYINYHNAFDFETDLQRYLENQADQLIEARQFHTAFELTIYAFVKLGNWDIDDDGEVTAISNTCYSIWQSILSFCSGEDRSWIKTCIERLLDEEAVIDYQDGILREFLKYEMAAPDELKAEIDHLDQLIEASGKSNKCKCVFTYHYGFAVEAVTLRMILMKKLGLTDEQIDAFRQNHRNFRSVRQYYLEKARSAGDVEEEIRILKESKLLDADSEYLVYTYSGRLICLYKSRGQSALEKAERREALLYCQMATVDDFREYRNMCTAEEWQEERLLIISTRESPDMKYELLAEEGLLPELFAQISESDDKLSYYNKYGFLLADLYSEQILAEYRKYVCHAAENARNRAAYDELVRYLLRMKQYKGGPALVQKLCAELIEKYPTRKVMVEELKKVM